jgi:hypothetical protein
MSTTNPHKIWSSCHFVFHKGISESGGIFPILTLALGEGSHLNYIAPGKEPKYQLKTENLEGVHLLGLLREKGIAYLGFFFLDPEGICREYYFVHPKTVDYCKQGQLPAILHIKV